MLCTPTAKHEPTSRNALLFRVSSKVLNEQSRREQLKQLQ